MNRRKLIIGTGLASIPTISGCIDNNANAADENNDDQSSENDDRENNNGDGSIDLDSEATQVLGAAPSISIESEPDRDYDYLKDEDRVQIQYDGGGTDEMPFDEWGTRQATSAAADHILTLLDEEGVLKEGIRVGEAIFDLDDLEDNSEESPDSTEFERDVDIGPVVSYLEDDSKDDEIEVEFETVVESTPRSIEVSMLFDEGEYTAILPVMCMKGQVEEDRP